MIVLLYFCECLLYADKERTDRCKHFIYVHNIVCLKKSYEFEMRDHSCVFNPNIFSTVCLMHRPFAPGHSTALDECKPINLFILLLAGTERGRIKHGLTFAFLTRIPPFCWQGNRRRFTTTNYSSQMNTRNWCVHAQKLRNSVQGANTLTIVDSPDTNETLHITILLIAIQNKHQPQWRPKQICKQKDKSVAPFSAPASVCLSAAAATNLLSLLPC
jgi:hypothetical protein